MGAKGHTLYNQEKKEGHFVAPLMKEQAILPFFFWTGLRFQGRDETM